MFLTQKHLLLHSCYLWYAGKGKVKGKVHPRTSHEGPKGDYRYSSTISLTSALDGGDGWSRPFPQ